MSPLIKWYCRTLVRVCVSAPTAAKSAAGIFAKAASVGIRAVNGPKMKLY